MIDKYEKQFKKMYERITKGENASSVIAEYIPVFIEEGICMSQSEIDHHYRKYERRNNK